MGLYSAQQWFCNACGKEHLSIPFANPKGAYGGDYKTCDRRCADEMRMRYASSILGASYEPWSYEPPKEEKVDE